MRVLILAAVLTSGPLFGCEGNAGGSPGVGGSGVSGASSSGSSGLPVAGSHSDAGHAPGGAGGLSPSGGAPVALGGAAGAPVSPHGGGGTSGAGAGGAAGSSRGGTSGHAGAPPSTGGTAGAGAPDESSELYDPAQIPRFDIELSAEAAAALTRDGDAYVPATFRFGSETVADVGIRIKGEGSLRPLTQKAAFKLKFDEFVDDQSFKGLRRMTLNNMVEDPSFLAERLAYHVFRALGLPAPRCNNALVYVNSEFYGVYANVEAEDKTFLRRWFTSDAGNLYEEGRADFVPGAEQMFELETNESANDRTDLAELIELVASATPENFMEHVGQKLDMDHFLRFTATEAAVNQWDMYAYTVFYPNNFRLYHDPMAERFVFLPWGMDMSMKPFRDSGKPFISIFSLARQGDSRGGPISAGLLFRKCLESAPCKAALSREFEDVIVAYDSAGLEELAGVYYEQVKPHVLADPRKEYTEDEFERGYRSLLSTIRGRTAAIRAEL